MDETNQGKFEIMIENAIILQNGRHMLTLKVLESILICITDPDVLSGPVVIVIHQV